MSTFIKIGSRSSHLAHAQVKEIMSLLAKGGQEFTFQEVFYTTHGDKDKKMSLTQTPDNFFTDTLDEALLKGEIDLTIHSAKDLPQKGREGLEVFAFTKSLDDTDAFVGKVKLSELKPGSRVGTSSLLRQKAVKELNPQLEVIDIRGTIEERIQLVEDGQCDGIIVATAALKRLGLSYLIKDIMPWEAIPLQGQLAVVGRKGDQRFKEIFAAIDIREKFGRVYLVGAGPGGDPELITVKGLKILKKADCIFYDYLAPKDVLQQAPQAEKVYVGKRKGEHTMPQSELNKLLRQRVMMGKTVVRLKGGDPLIFGRGSEEIEYLRAYHIEVEIIPGVSSATGIPGILGIPLTARGVSSSVAFLSGHQREEYSVGNFPGAEEAPKPLDIPRADTLIFFMGLTKLGEIVFSLNKAGWKEETPILVVSKGTYPDEKIIEGTLKDIQEKVDEEHLEPPALIIVGEVVKLRKATPKKGYILFTGTNPEKYSYLGNLIHFPMIGIRQSKIEKAVLRNFLENLASFDIILLTSRFGVAYFFQILKDNDYELNTLKAKQWLTIGQETAQALRGFGVESSFIAQDESSEGLVKEMEERFPLRGKRILFPRSSLPNPYLKEKLTDLGLSLIHI